MELTKGQQAVMDADGDLLVTGGPGSGKTTVSILKAAQIAERSLRAGQQILFLSFARATVSRVVEAIEHEQQIPATTKRRIEVETYHAFFWRVLKAHGYLIGLPRRLSLLTPPNEAIALAAIRAGFPAGSLTDERRREKRTAEAVERMRLAREEGKICFDLFATFVGDLLHGSVRVRRLVATMYPAILLDEFQDTNEAQWRVVRELGEFCRLIALADPEQRIYDWIGADPARLDHFRDAFEVKDVDLSTDNHRSAGTDIAAFGNDVLAGEFRQAQYGGIELEVFVSAPDPAMTKLATTIYAARQRLLKANADGWSLAVLVPTKKLARLVSDSLRNPPGGLQAIHHSATLEIEGAILAAEIIALMLQPSTGQQHFAQFIDLLCNYYQGRNGDSPTLGALKEAQSIRDAYAELLERRSTGKPPRQNSVITAMLAVYEQARGLVLTGDPDKDWRALRQVLEDGPCKRLKDVAEEVKNLRLLDRGSQLRQQLSADWRENRYREALAIVRQAFVQDHFSARSKPESGVVVMNMHKAKGKQFDEVIIFEGWPKRVKREIVANPDRIVRLNLKENADNQARQNFRVSVTRSKQRTTILTPADDACVLLLP